MNSRSSTDDFPYSIDPLSMKFKNSDLEQTYEKERTRKTIHVKIVILTTISIWFGFSLRSLQAYLNFELVSNPNRKSTLNLLIMSIVGFITMILEIIISNFSRMKLFKGFIFTIPMCLGLMHTTYQYNIVLANSSPYFPPILISMILCIISMAFIYCCNWICGVLLIFSTALLIEICCLIYPWLILDKLFVSLHIFLAVICICSTLIFYEYQRRENFYMRNKIQIQNQNITRILNNIPLGIVVSENKKIVEVNDSFKKLIGIPPLDESNNNESSNKNSPGDTQIFDGNVILTMTQDFKILESNETLRNYIEFPQTIKECVEFYLCSKKNNSKIPFEVITTKIETQEGGQIIFTLKNMAAYHELNEIKARQKYSTMFISSISHDFRTHLNIIEGNLDLINTSNSIDNTQKEYLQAIRKSTSFLSILVQDLLDFLFLKEKKFKLNLSNFNIVGLIDELCSLFAEKFMDKGLFLETIIPNQIPDEIHSDKMRVTQVISNLLSNSWKFTIRGGVYVKLNYDQSKNLMLLSVKDTGIGIAPENISRVMKPFLRIEDSMHLNENGIGLGLNISKKIAKKLNGSIKISSEVGVGSEFVFCFKVFNFPHGDTVSEICKEEHIDYSYILNVCSPELIKNEESLSSERSSLKNGSNDPSFIALVSRNKNNCYCPKILIVDDEIGNRNVLTNYCKHLNILSEQAINGFDALQCVEMYPTSHNCCHNYKLILMDSNMPIMNGEESSLKIRKFINQSNFENPFIICITANATKNKDNAQDELKYIYDDIYFKPIRFDTFKEIVHKYKLF